MSPNNSPIVHSLDLSDSIQASLPVNAQWSLFAVDTKAGEKLLDIGNAKESPLIPASLVKLLTTAAVFDLNAKGELSIDTTISADGKVAAGVLDGNLYLAGSGNAFLAEADLESAVEDMLSKGIKEVTGNIVADDFLFDAKQKGEHRGPAYASPAALGLDLHTIAITVSDRSPNAKVEPANGAVKVIIRGEGKPGIRQIDDLTYEVSTPPSGRGIIKRRFSLKDPALYAGGTFKSLLLGKGINVRGTVSRGKTPAYASRISSIKSKALSEIIKDTNQNSLNVSADNLLLFLGAKRFGAPGTTEKGVKAIYAFLDRLGVDHQGMMIADGSGLSKENMITSGQMANFLNKISKEPWFERFYESLPAAGAEGTLKDLSYSGGIVRAKTGRLQNSYCLAGYIERNDKSKIAFAYMLNVPAADLAGSDVTTMLLSRLEGLHL